MKVKKESKNSYKNYIQTYFQQEKLFTLDSELEGLQYNLLNNLLIKFFVHSISFYTTSFSLEKETAFL
jgi:hypothetical protein